MTGSFSTKQASDAIELILLRSLQRPWPWLEQEAIISNMEISCIYSDIYFTLFLIGIGLLLVV